MKEQRASLITSLLLSLFALIIHSVFLFDYYVGGTGLTDKNDAFNSHLLKMHVSVHWPMISLLLIIILSYLIFSMIIYFCVIFLDKEE